MTINTTIIEKKGGYYFMKKFIKFVITLAAVCAAVAGALYFVKNILMKDYLDDYDEDDFDNDLYDEDDDFEDRGYVVLSNGSAEKEEDLSEDVETEE